MPKHKTPHTTDEMQHVLLHYQQENAELARQLHQRQQQLSEAMIQVQQLQLEHQNTVNWLNQRLEQARREYFDLELLLRTTTEHADALEEALSHKVDLIASEKSDLEIILETITEHADQMAGELLEKAESRHPTVLKQNFLNEIKILRRRIDELKREKFDLQLLLETTTAHADALEDALRNRRQLEDQKDQKKNPLNESLSLEKAMELYQLIGKLKLSVTQLQQEKLDLEMLLQTSTEHADVLEDALRKRAEEALQEKSDLEILLETTTEHSALVENELQHQAEEVARASERRLAQFLEAVPVGVLVLDSTSKPYYANRMAQHIFGENLWQKMEFLQFEDASQFAHHILEDFIHKSHSTTKPPLCHLLKISEQFQTYLAGTNTLYPDELQPIVRSLQGESASIDDMELHQQGKIIPLEVWSTPIFDEHGDVSYAITVFQDITHRKQAEAQRIRLIQEQEAHKAALRVNEQLQQEINEREKVEAALHKANQELLRLATLDGLTQIPNRRRLDEYLDQEWKRAIREQLSLAFIMCDVDFFKRYNDTYGHQAGDKCLQQVAQAINHAVKRSVDLAARYGGEEFAVVLPNTHLAGAVQVATEIAQAIAALQLPHSNSTAAPIVSLSIGVAAMIPTVQTPLTVLVQAADTALYQAKMQGRNRVVSHS